MAEINEVLDKIKSIQCPVDEFENRVKSAFELFDYEFSNEIIVERKENLDREDLKAYKAYSKTKDAPVVMVYEKEGYDHYVSAVEDAYLEY